MEIAVRCLAEGIAEGPVTILHAPLSFWGGFDVGTGSVIDRGHPAFGEVLTGRILVMPSGRGSSSASSVLAEAIRIGTAPAGIILAEVDSIIPVGAMVANKLYGKSCPVVVWDAFDVKELEGCGRARLVAGEDSAIIVLL